MSASLLTPELLHILQHSLGVDEHGFGDQYRNYFCAGGGDVDKCRELVAMGYMQQFGSSNVFPDSNFAVTTAGKLAMAEQSPKPPKLTRSQQRWQEYAKVADCFDDFAHWLKYTKARKALDTIPEPRQGRGA